MSPDSFRKLFDRKRADRKLYRNGDPSEEKQYRGTIECHSTYYIFAYDDETGMPRESRSDYRSVIPDDDGRGFRLPFFAPFDGWDGFHYTVSGDET